MDARRKVEKLLTFVFCTVLKFLSATN